MKNNSNSQLLKYEFGKRGRPIAIAYIKLSASKGFEDVRYDQNEGRDKQRMQANFISWVVPELSKWDYLCTKWHINPRLYRKFLYFVKEVNWYIMGENRKAIEYSLSDTSTYSQKHFF